MKVVTVNSDLNNIGFLDFLKPSCKFYNLDIIVLEYNRSFFSYRIKDFLLQNFLNKIPDDEIIFFTDATDTIFLTNIEEILEKYICFNSRLVFSGEVNCWPDNDLRTAYPAPQTYFRYLNSGGFMGEAGFIKSLYKKYPVFNTANHPNYEWSNQYYWHYVYLKEHKYITIDHNAEIFYNFASPLDNIDAFNKRLRDPVKVEEMVKVEKQRIDNEIEFFNGRIKSNITYSTPCHVHLPNPVSKLLMKYGYLDRIKK